MITFENPPTTIFVEAKYGSALSAKVSGDDGSSGYPSDQLIRNIRVGLLRSGYFNRNDGLFDESTRDFVVLVLSPIKGHPLVDRYRDPEKLRSAIPKSEKLIGLPRSPFVGQLDYDDIKTTLERQLRWMTAPERRVVVDLTGYLDFKRANLPPRSSIKPMEPAFLPSPIKSDHPEVQATRHPLKILSVH